MTVRSKAAAALFFFAAACGREGRAPDIDDQPPEPVAPAEETLPMEASGQPLFVGVWAADPDWCDITPGSGDPAPIALTEGEFVGYENRCRIGDYREGTEGGYQVALVCEAEGVEYSEIVELDIDGVMMRMRRAEGPETVFTRCEEDAGE